jgi:hypothetical protein
VCGNIWQALRLLFLFSHLYEIVRPANFGLSSQGEKPMEKREYRGFVLSWHEPPLTGAAWVVNVAAEVRGLQSGIGNGAEVIPGPSRDEAIAKAMTYVDGLLA